MIIQRNSDGTYSASGGGYNRPIIVEADSPREARRQWIYEYGRQYAEGEAMTANSLDADPCYAVEDLG